MDFTLSEPLTPPVHRRRRRGGGPTGDSSGGPARTKRRSKSRPVKKTPAAAAAETGPGSGSGPSQTPSSSTAPPPPEQPEQPEQPERPEQPEQPVPDPTDGDAACLSVVLCPSDGGYWSALTCALLFAARFACDGVCASLFLLDDRFGMVDRAPPFAHTVEHLAVVHALRHAIEPFSCAFINWYGFRRCLFGGSLLTVTWITLIRFTENAFFSGDFYCFGLAVVGGIGMGMINTSFSVLLSCLYVLNRHTAHLAGHLGSFAGMLFVPPFTEYVLTYVDWRAALTLHMGLIVPTICLWLFVTTPCPLSIRVTDRKPLLTSHHSEERPVRFATTASADAAGYSPQIYQFPTIQEVVGTSDDNLRTVPLTDTTTLYDCRTRQVQKHTRHVSWSSQGRDEDDECIRNVTNIFAGERMIGSRPMYRDDVFFDGNITALATNIQFNEYIDYLMATTRVFTVADLNEEKQRRWCSVIFPTAVRRVLKSMLDSSILGDIKFILYAISEALVHAACYVPFVFIKGPLGQKSTPEATISLIAGCSGLLYGRGVGYLLHETTSKMVPLYHVSLVLIVNGLALLLCMARNIGKIIPFFGIFGFFFGYYKSIQNFPMYTMFPLKTFNNVRGYISIVRGLSSLLGIMSTLIFVLRTKDGTWASSNETAYVFAGILMMAGGVFVSLMQPLSEGGQLLNSGNSRQNWRPASLLAQP